MAGHAIITSRIAGYGSRSHARIRYSLRSLFAATLVIAVCLAARQYLISSFQTQNRFAQELREMGCTVRTVPVMQSWLGSLIRCGESLETIESVELPRRSWMTNQVLPEGFKP